MALPHYKDIVDLLKKGATLEAQEKILELREAALEIQEENIELKQRVRDLENALRKRGATVFENSAYWTIEEDKKDGPFCQRCYDAEGILVRLHRAKFQKPSDMQWGNGARCSKCETKHELQI